MLFEVLLLLPLLTAEVSSSRIPQAQAPALVRSPAPAALVVRDINTELEPRLVKSEVFDIGFELKNEELYSGSWDFAPPAPIPVPGLPPVTVEPKNTIAFTLKCNDCRTYGEIIAEMDTEGDGVTFGLTFNKAGAYLDFGISASNELTATFALGHFLSTGNLTSGAFAAKLGLGLNLVLSFTAAIDMSGGFQLCIPDGTKLAFKVDIGLDDDTTGLSATSDVTTFPDVTFSLLPIEVSSSAVNITAALILKAEAGIDAQVGLISGTAAAGASLTIAQVSLGATTTNQEGQCSRALFADIESNAGAFAKAGLTFDEEELFEPPNFNVSTVFATAGTTACIGTKIPTIPTFTPGLQTDVPACEDGVVPATELTTITKTNTLTSCLAAVVNCPASLTQVVVLTKEEAITTTFCPTASASASASSRGSLFITIPTNTIKARGNHHPASQARSTKDYSSASIATTTVPAVSAIKGTVTSSFSISASLAPPASSNPVSQAPACPTNGVKLSELTDYITRKLPENVLTIAPAENATITGTPELPPKTTSPTAIPTPVVGVVEAGAGQLGAGRGLIVILGLGVVLLGLL
ncbi:hypothetical protein V8F20_006368 [Naviculisporaceae sp. PSN 640]